MIVAGNRLRKVGIQIRFTGKHGHYGEAIVAGGAERAKTFYIWDCHDLDSLANLRRASHVCAPGEHFSCILFL